MKIKKLEFDVHTNKWKLSFESNNQTLILNEETIVHFELIQGKHLTRETLTAILKYDAIQEYYGQALHFLSRRRTAHEVFQFLTLKKKASIQDAESVIEMLISQQYLNDFEYAKASIHDQISFQKKSFFAACEILKKKGIIDSDLLEELRYWYDSNEMLQNTTIENINILIKQLKKSNKQYNNYERNQRIIAKLCQKGYNKDTIKILLNTETPAAMDENEKRKLLEKHRHRVFQAKNCYQYLSYMRKYDIDKEELLTFFNNERMNQND